MLEFRVEPKPSKRRARMGEREPAARLDIRQRHLDARVFRASETALENDGEIQIRVPDAARREMSAFSDADDLLTECRGVVRRRARERRRRRDFPVPSSFVVTVRQTW